MSGERDTMVALAPIGDALASAAHPAGPERTTIDWASACLARGQRERAGSLLAAVLDVLGDLDLAESRRRYADLVDPILGRTLTLVAARTHVRL